MRIGFLFNHDQTHQVAHALPIAAALARARPDIETVIAVTNDALADEVDRIARRLGAALPRVRLSHRRTAIRAAAWFLDHLLPASRISIYRDNLDFFQTLDALVVAEKTSLLLKHRYGMSLPIIHTRHGAGDRAIGFNRASAAFDHVLVSGPKIRDRLVAEAGVQASKISVVGYPKFDIPRARWIPPFADPTRPTVLYNPHPAPHLSSWYRHGRAVLDFFAGSDRYNLIFAPHVMLFQRPFAVTAEPFGVAWVGRVPPRIYTASNVHVDFGSPASTDMTYIDAADIYLGDVSSQVYEFIRQPRPCLFLNSHGADFGTDPNYRAWRSGPVIEEPAMLGAALEEARSDHFRYRSIQQTMITETFEMTEESSSDRAARAILRSLEATPPQPSQVSAPVLA